MRKNMVSYPALLRKISERENRYHVHEPGFDRCKKGTTGLGGFEPPTSGLEARRYVQAKPQALF